ncbi:MAG: hypothetical protein H7Z76_04750 [Methylotenera sp.]|nr:hypothetical protein [Flavobacterium sp.]
MKAFVLRVPSHWKLVMISSVLFQQPLPSYTFTSDTNSALKVVTSGYNIDKTPANIYKKGGSLFGDEDGIGMLVDAGNGKEIDRFHFVQTDFK